jgi:hypothetical protein
MDGMDSFIQVLLLPEGFASAWLVMRCAAGAPPRPAAPPTSSACTCARACQVSGALRVVALEDATSATCGAKGAACGELLRLAKHCNEILSGSPPASSAPPSAASAPAQGAGGLEGNGGGPGPLFRAPDGVCLPFGCMDVALKVGERARACRPAGQAPGGWLLLQQTTYPPPQPAPAGGLVHGRGRAAGCAGLAMAVGCAGLQEGLLVC